MNVGRLLITPEGFHCALSVLGEKLDTLEQIIADQSAIARLSNIHIVKQQDIPGLSGDEEEERIVALSRIYQAVSGDKPSFDALPSVSLLGSLAEKNPKLPITAIGVDVLNEGRPDEGLAMDSLTRLANILMEYLKQL